MFTVTVSIQCHFIGSRKTIRQRKKSSKKHLVCKRRNKTISVCRWFIYRKSKFLLPLPFLQPSLLELLSLASLQGICSIYKHQSSTLLMSNPRLNLRNFTCKGVKKENETLGLILTKKSKMCTMNI